MKDENEMLNAPEKDIDTDTAEYNQRKAKLAKTMTIMIILIVALFGLMVVLNKYYNG